MAVVVVGSANLDIVLGVGSIPGPGETVLSLSRTEYGGGKGLNQALACARSGVETTLVAKVGNDDAGRGLTTLLSESGVAVLGGQGTCATGTATVIVARNGENVIVVSPGCNAELTELGSKARDAVICADTALLQLEIPLSVVVETATLASNHGTRVILNAAPATSLPPEVLGHTDLLVVNESEAFLTAGAANDRRGAGSNSDVAAVIAVLLRLVPTVVVTLGERGALSGERTDAGPQISSHPAPKVRAIDTTGAGDTFCGALAAELSRGSKLHQSVDYAVTAGSLSVQKAGAAASIPHRNDIETALNPERGAAQSVR